MFTVRYGLIFKKYNSGYFFFRGSGFTHWSVTKETRVRSRSSLLRFVIDILSMGTFLTWVILISHATIILQMLRNNLYSHAVLT
jgi:hypothetical protein